MSNSTDIKEKRWERQQKKKNGKKEGLDNALVGNPSSKTVSYHRNVLTGGNLNDYEDLMLSPSGGMDNDYNIGNNYRNLTSNELGDVIEGIDNDVLGLGQGKKRGRRKGKSNSDSNNGKKNSNNGDKEPASNYKFVPWDSLFNEGKGRRTKKSSSMTYESVLKTKYNINGSKNSNSNNNNHGGNFSKHSPGKSERSDVSSSSSPWNEEKDASYLPEDDEEWSGGSNTLPDENITLKKRKNEKKYNHGGTNNNYGNNNNLRAYEEDREDKSGGQGSTSEPFIHNPEPDEDVLDIEEFSEEPDLCFFCHFYTKSEGLKASNMNIGIMLKLIEDMLFKGNISIEAVGIEAEYYYNKNIYQPALLQGKYNTPKIVASDIVNHYRKHMNICPSIHYSNTFQILFNAREVLKDRLFLLNSETGEIVPSKQNYELMLKTIQVMNAIHNADLTKSPYYDGDGLHWSMKTKGAFLNDGTNITEEHKKMMNDWKEEPYKPMFIEDID